MYWFLILLLVCNILLLFFFVWILLVVIVNFLCLLCFNDEDSEKFWKIVLYEVYDIKENLEKWLNGVLFFFCS